MRRKLWLAALALVAAVGIPVLGAAAPAMAEGTPTQITFATTSPLQTAFGGNWVARVDTVFEGSDFAVPGSDATVSVFIAGQTDAFVTGLPIQPDGAAYFSQPASKAPLAAGQYQLTATIVPVAGSNIAGSQTATPLVLTVAAYAISADVSVDSSSVPPVIVAKLSGDYVDTTKSLPAGTWTFTVTRGAKKVLTEEVAQAAGVPADLRVPITAKLDDGATYSVSAKFAAIDSVAPGLDVTQPKDSEFSTASSTLASRVPFPLWAVVVTAVVFAALVAAAIVLQVNLQKRRASTTPAADAEGGSNGIAAPAVDPGNFLDSGPGYSPTSGYAPTAVYTAPLTTDPAQPAEVAPAATPAGEFTQLLTGIPAAQPPAAEPPAAAEQPAAQPLAVSQQPPADPPDDAPGSWSLQG